MDPLVGGDGDWATGRPFGDPLRPTALLRVAQNAAWAVGPAIGGFMAGWSYALMFAATSFSSVICLALLQVTKSPRPHELQ